MSDLGFTGTSSSPFLLPRPPTPTPLHLIHCSISLEDHAPFFSSSFTLSVPSLKRFFPASINSAGSSCHSGFCSVVTSSDTHLLITDLKQQSCFRNLLAFHLYTTNHHFKLFTCVLPENLVHSLLVNVA